MRLLLMCASEVSEAAEVMEGGWRKSDEEEEGRFCDANSCTFSLLHPQTTGVMQQRT